MKKFLLINLILFGSLLSVSAQIIADSISLQMSLKDNPEVTAFRSSSTISFDQVKKNRDWKHYDSTYFPSRNNAIWLKFQMANSSNDTVFNYFLSKNQYVTIYQKDGEEFKIYRNGSLVPLSQRSNPFENFFIKLTFAPQHKSEIFVRLYDHNPTPANYPKIFSERGYWEMSKKIERSQAIPIGFIYFYIISLITIITFALVFYFRLRENLYLYYLGYLFFQLIYGFLVLRSTSASIGNFFNLIPELSYELLEPVQFIFIAFYVFFILQLLKVKRYDKLLAKFLFALGVLCGMYAAARFVLSYFFFDPQITGFFFTVIRIIVLPLNLFLIFWIIHKVRHPLLSYFIVGQAFFFVGAIIASYLGYSGVHYVPGHFFNFMEAPNIVFQAGLLAEVYCFSIAIGQNIFLLQKEKNIATNSLIEQFKENRLLQEQMNEELDRKVNEKTSELIGLYIQLERQQEEQSKADFTQKLKTMEMMALRSQMDPHFIFNSLNAIKHLIMTLRNEDAIEYLDNFSILLRNNLQNSNKEIITVEEELETLELYLSLEKIRMGENFNYSIMSFSREELSQFYIPPMFLQPFAENAIWHGLNPSTKKEKKLNITFDTSQKLKIIIEDNGIGRNLSKQRSKLHKSMGMKITQERLSLFNYLNSPSINLHITDLGTATDPLGTRVTLTYRD